jgi:FtsZ-interacting cell division protein ZipA
MNDTGENRLQAWAAVAAALAGFLLIRKWRKRRQRKKVEKILKKREKARLKEKRKTKEKAISDARKRRKEAVRKAKKKAAKERSMLQQLVRFAVFQLLKKMISEQIKGIEMDLGKSRLGERLVSSQASST